MIGGAQEDIIENDGVGKEKGCVHNSINSFRSGGILLIACS
jgi:hypothetical protein